MKKIFLLIITLIYYLGYAQQKKPNVLWLDLEDLSPILAAYGDSTISTPHIDRLAKEGITFTKAYACAGVCAPSRASIITGMYPTAIGAHNMRIEANPKYPSVPAYEVVPPPYVRCFPDILRENGIFTSCSKKTDYQFAPSPFTWDEYPKNNEIDRYEFNMPQPFFKQINFWETHESQIFDWCRQNVPLSIEVSKVKVPPYLPQTETTKLDWATQYNNLKYTDEKIGRILAALEEKKLLQNTIIILTGDHGNGLPRSKRTVYESGVKVPMIIRFPNKVMEGKKINKLVSLMDLGPTILSMYNISIPSYMQGKSVIDTVDLKNRKLLFFSADRFDEERDMIRALTNGKLKYIRNFHPEKPQFLNISFRKSQNGVKELYELDSLGKLDPIQANVMRKTKPSEELFDLENDPFELTNLIDKPRFKIKVKEFRAALEDWMRTNNDMGYLNENDIANIFWPKSIQPKTVSPQYSQKEKKITISCETKGASIGYKFKNSQSWRIYREPFEIKIGDSLYIAAHRLGWKTSEIISILKK